MARMTRRSFLTTAILASGGVLLTACGSMGNSMGTHNMNTGATGTAATAGMGDYDQMFIDTMVPHHQAAIDMAKIAQRKAERAELRQLADAIVGAQDGEIAQMKAWRKAWYGSDEIAPGMGSTMAGMNTDLAQLENATPFDKAFIEAMIPHHQSAIDMAQEATTRAQRQEIKDLAAKIITAQQAEIDQMTRWRNAWYPG